MVRPYECWPDEDGKHIWFRHKCVNGYVEFILPPPWTCDGEKVTPSVDCTLCKFHMNIIVTGAPK